MGLWHTYMGDPRQGLALLDRALESNPYPTSGIWSMRANTVYQLGKHAETVACIDRMTVPSPWDIPYVVASLARMGGERSLARLRLSYRDRLANEFPALVRHVDQEPYRRAEDRDRLMGGLALARALVRADAGSRSSG